MHTRAQLLKSPESRCVILSARAYIHDMPDRVLPLLMKRQGCDLIQRVLAHK